MPGRLTAIILMLSAGLLLLPHVSLSGADASANAVVWEADPGRGTLRELVQWHGGNVTLAVVDGSQRLCLGLPATAEKPAVELIFPAIPVEAGVKYRLSLQARLEGPDTLSENPQLSYLFFHYDKAAAGKTLPGWGFRFSDADGRECSRRLPFFHTAVMHHDWRTYTETFYAPPGAVRVQLLLGNRKNPDNVLQVGQVRLERVNDGCLNIQPDFADGPEDYSGYNYGVRQRLVPHPDGGWRLDVRDGWFSGDPFPVTAGAEYRLTVQLETIDKIGRLSLHLLDPAQGKAGVLKQTIRQSAPGRRTHLLDFVVPDGAAWLRLVGSGGFFERIVVQRVQAEGAE